MSLEQGCRLRLQKTDDGRRAVALLDRQELRLVALDAVLQAIREGWTLELQGPRPGIGQEHCRGWIEPTVVGSEHKASIHAEGAEPESVLVELGLRWKEQEQ